MAQPKITQDNTDRSALVVGATGLVGSELLKLLLDDPRYSRVYTAGRRAPRINHTKLTAHVVDMANPRQLAALPQVDDVYCALGTTIKVAGSQAAFKAIDLDAVVAVAKATVRKNAAMRLGVVSAMGADAKAGVFYNRIKGEMEAAVAELGYESVSIARPSMLAGDRDSLKQASRLGEQIGLKLMTAVSFLIPANYKAIEAFDVASALHRMVTKGHRGVRVAMSGELRALAHAAS